jgi:deazaflavin-dependent oxidoreductase (nitroreductase family)
VAEYSTEMDWEAINNAVIAEFRENEGKCGGNFEGAPMCLLNTIGAKTGSIRTKPLVYLEEGGRYHVFASFAGAPAHPPWYHNIIANPVFDFEVGTEKFKVRAEELAEPERTEMYNKQVAAMSVFKDYAEKAGRVIPVFALSRV